MFIEILFKMLLFKGGVLIYAEHCMVGTSAFNLWFEAKFLVIMTWTSIDNTLRHNKQANMQYILYFLFKYMK